MAGTLWEWCQNRFEEPDVSDFSTYNAARVLRGGSWSDFRDYARSAYRGRVLPSNRGYDFGFRVVCSSPSSEH